MRAHSGRASPVLENCRIVGRQRVHSGSLLPVRAPQPPPQGRSSPASAWDPAGASSRRRRENPGNRPLAAGAVEKVTSAAEASHPLLAAGGGRRGASGGRGVPAPPRRRLGPLPPLLCPSGPHSRAAGETRGRGLPPSLANPLSRDAQIPDSPPPPAKPPPPAEPPRGILESFAVGVLRAAGEAETRARRPGRGRRPAAVFLHRLEGPETSSPGAPTRPRPVSWRLLSHWPRVWILCGKTAWMEGRLLLDLSAHLRVQSPRSCRWGVPHLLAIHRAGNRSRTGQPAPGGPPAAPRPAQASLPSTRNAASAPRTRVILLSPLSSGKPSVVMARGRQAVAAPASARSQVGSAGNAPSVYSRALSRAWCVSSRPATSSVLPSKWKISGPSPSQVTSPRDRQVTFSLEKPVSVAPFFTKISMSSVDFSFWIISNPRELGAQIVF